MTVTDRRFLSRTLATDDDDEDDDDEERESNLDSVGPALRNNRGFLDRGSRGLPSTGVVGHGKM